MADKQPKNGEETQLEQILSQLAQVQQQVTNLQQENAELRKLVTAKSDPAEAAKPKPLPVIPAETFERGGEEYKFVSAKFTLPARKSKEGKGREEALTITAVDALADDAILTELVEIGSGVIAKVTKD